MDTSTSRTRFVTLLGTAAAAATATFVASRLGVAGTIAGAALVAVIASIGAELYTTAARRTSDRVAALARAGRAPGAPATAADAGTDGQQPLWPQERPSDGDDPVSVASPPAGRGRDLRFSWVHVAGVAGIVFVTVLVGITALELVAGRPLSSWWTNDDSSGTTIGQVVDPPAAKPPSTPPPSSTSAPTDLPSTGPVTTPPPEPTTPPPSTPPPVTSPAPATPAAGAVQGPA